MTIDISGNKCLDDALDFGGHSSFNAEPDCFSFVLTYDCELWAHKGTFVTPTEIGLNVDLKMAAISFHSYSRPRAGTLFPQSLRHIMMMDDCTPGDACACDLALFT